MREEALSDCTAKPSKTASGFPARSVIVMSLSTSSLVADHDADVDRHVLFGCTVDGAVPDPGREVRVLVLLLPEKWCAEQRLEGAVDERRMESVSHRVRRRSLPER